MVYRDAYPGSGQVIAATRMAGPVDYGQNQPRPKIIKLALDNAQSPTPFDVTGDFLWAIAASDISALISVQYQDQTSDAFPFSEGTFFTWPFSRLFLSWPAQPGKTITLAYARTVAGQPPFVVNPALAFNSVQLAGNLNGVVERPGTLIDVADVAVPNAGSVVLRASTATDRRRLIVNTGANAIRVGAAPAASTGALVQPSGSITLMGSYAVSAFGSGGASTASVTVEAD